MPASSDASSEDIIGPEGGPMDRKRRNMTQQGIVGIANAGAPLRQRLLTICTHLEPYADVQVVKDLDTEMRVLLLHGKR